MTGFRPAMSNLAIEARAAARWVRAHATRFLNSWTARQRPQLSRDAIREANPVAMGRDAHWERVMSILAEARAQMARLEAAQARAEQQILAAKYALNVVHVGLGQQALLSDVLLTGPNPARRNPIAA